MTDKEVMQQALATLERVAAHLMRPQDVEVMQAIRAQLDQPDRQTLQAAGVHLAPCARHCESKAYEIEIRSLKSALRTAPQRKPLTDEQIWEIHDRCIPPTEGYVSPVDFARAIEAAHGIGEGT